MCGSSDNHAQNQEDSDKMATSRDHLHEDRPSERVPLALDAVEVKWDKDLEDMHLK